MQTQNPAHAAGEPWPRPGIAWYAVVILVVAFVFSFIDRIIIAMLVEPEQCQQLACAVGQLLLAPSETRRGQQRADQRPWGAGLQTGLHVVDDRQVVEQADVLERADDAESSDGVCRAPRDVDVVEPDRAG